MKAERKQRIRDGLRSVRLHALTAAAACFFATATTGCVSDHGGNAVIESHFTRLEQTCFGYEPTVWRTMSGQCESVQRQIPEPVITVPKASATTPAPETTPPTEPKESALETVPEPGQESGGSGLFRNLMGPPITPNEGSTPSTEPTPGTEPKDEATPPTEPVPGTEPAEDTTPVEPRATALQPAEETPGESAVEPTSVPEPAPVNPPQAEPTTPPPAEPPAPQFSFSSSRQVVTAPANMQSSGPSSDDASASPEARNDTANELFRTLESALGDASQPKRAPKAAPKKGPTGLAKFISY